jgi:8-hydroxy-5-deazaflavin:NADPH oxidoreductase
VQGLANAAYLEGFPFPALLSVAPYWVPAGIRIGREGGDVSEAEVVVVAVPGGTIAEALDNVRGMEGKTVIDATNLVGVDPPEGFSSNAEFVKSTTNGSTAKSFNANFAALYDRIGEAHSTPSKTCGAARRRRGRLSSSSTEM